MNHYILSYAMYLPASILLTIWVARVLSKNGRIFLIDIFHGKVSITDSVNRLPVVGFYLINTGYRSLVLKKTGPIPGTREVVVLNSKPGRTILIPVAMHFFNPAVFSNSATGHSSSQNTPESLSVI